MPFLDFPTTVPQGDLNLDQAKQFDQQVAGIRAQAEPTPAPAPAPSPTAVPSPALVAHGSYYADPNFGQDLARYRDRVEQLAPGMGDFAAAQARLETGSGQQFSTPYNFGNINNTDSNPKGGGGFSGPEAAADAYVNFLTNNGGQTRYQALLDAGKRGADVATLATLAKTAGYATDPNYAAKVAAIAGQPLPAGMPVPTASPSQPPQPQGNPASDLLQGAKSVVGGAASAVGSGVQNELAKFDQLTSFDKAMADLKNAGASGLSAAGTAANNAASAVTGINPVPPAGPGNEGLAAHPPTLNDVGNTFNAVGTAIHNAPGPLGQLAGAAGDIANLAYRRPGDSPVQAALAPVQMLGQVTSDLNPQSIANTVGQDITGKPAPPQQSFPVLTGAANLANVMTAPGGVLGKSAAAPVGALARTEGAQVAAEALQGNRAVPRGLANTVADVMPNRYEPAGFGPGAASTVAPPPPASPALTAFNRAPAAANPLTGLGNKLEQQFADRFAALNRIGPQSEAAVGTFAGRTDAAVQRATQDLKPVYEAVADVPNGQQELNAYVGLNRYIEAADVTGNTTRLSPGVTSVADAKAQLADMQARLGPANFVKLQQADAIRQEAMDRLLQDKVNSGFLPQQTADFLKQTQPHYNPTTLVDYLDQAPPAGSKLSQRNGLIKALTQAGSEADQVPPMQSAINAIVHGSTNIQRNEVIKTVANEGGFTAEKASAMLPKDAVTFFDGGQRMALTNLPSDVSRAMNNMTTEQIQGWERVLSGLNKSIRLGATTLNPAFLATNAARDYVQAFIREGISPVQDVARMLPTARTKELGRMATEAGMGMGAEGGYFVRGNAGKSLVRLEQQIKSTGGLVIKTPADLKKLLPTNIIRNIGEAIEMGPRRATFENQAGLGKVPTAALAGMSGKGMEPAALAGRRVTVDFSRAGTSVRTLNSAVPFLNARVQGVLTTARTLRDNPAARARLAGLLATAGGAYAWNRQFPEYADVPDYIKQNYMVVMLPGSTKNPTGPGYQDIHYVAVPLGEWGGFVVPFEAAMRKIDGQNPGVMDTLAQTAAAVNPLSGNSLDTSMASLAPPLAKVRVELGMNKDFFRGQDIVPQSQQRLLPEQQIGPQTSLLAQRVGQATGTSPRKLDFAVREMTGGGGRLATQALSQLMGQPSDTAPVVGGLASGVYRNYGGQVQQSAYDARDKGLAELQSQQRDMYQLFGASGHPLGGPDAPPPATATISGVKVPLYPSDQLQYAQQRDALIAKVLARPGVADRVKAMPLAQRQAALGEVLTLADEAGKAAVLKGMNRDELRRRALAERDAPPKPVQSQDVSNLRFNAPAA